MSTKIRKKCRKINKWIIMGKKKKLETIIIQMKIKNAYF